MNRKRSSPQQIIASPEKKPKRKFNQRPFHNLTFYYQTKNSSYAVCLYLEDNTPIRTIEVSNVPTDLSEDVRDFV